jgi:hypothetical protein
MSGILGIEDPRHKVNIESLVERMGKTLAHRESFYHALIDCCTSNPPGDEDVQEAQHEVDATFQSLYKAMR